MSATIKQIPGKQVRAAVAEAVAAITTGTPSRSAALTPILITSANLGSAERFAEVK